MIRPSVGVSSVGVWWKQGTRMKNWLSFGTAVTFSVAASLLALSAPAQAEKRVDRKSVV